MQLYGNFVKIKAQDLHFRKNSGVYSFLNLISTKRSGFFKSYGSPKIEGIFIIQS